MASLKSWIFSCGFVLMPFDACFPHDELNLFNPGPQTAAIENAIQQVFDAYREAQTAGVSAHALDSAESVYAFSFTWQKHQLTVCFWNGAAAVQETVEDRANTWTKAANIKFLFRNGDKFRTCSDENSADIRISLDGHDKRHLYAAGQDDPLGDWSQIGTQSADLRHKVSLNLALLNTRIIQTLDPTNFDFHIRHEFGHALGLMHEHQRELCDGWFDYDAIAADNPGWTRDKAKANVATFRTEKIGGIDSFGPYDKNSIMQYNFRPNWYRPAEPPAVNPCKRDYKVGDLSPQDIEGVQKIYGKPIALLAEVSPPVTSAAAPAPPGVASSSTGGGRPDGGRSELTPPDLNPHSPDDAIICSVDAAIQLT